MDACLVYDKKQVQQTTHITVMPTQRMQERIRERSEERKPLEPLKQVSSQAASPAVASSLKCPKCGAGNEPEAMFCEQCGARLRERLCPHCGEPLDERADYCEQCHTYVDTEHCPFCYGSLSEQDTFCPQCGASLSGIECPVCHTVGRFGFCASCGSPLTDRARQDLQEAWENFPYKERMVKLEEELEHLWMVRPARSESQRASMEHVQQLCRRVKELMAQEGNVSYESQKPEEEAVPALMDEQELRKLILEKQEALQALLDSMEMAPQENSAAARNYAMARKPHVSRLAWKCNYKHAFHTSPLGCACPKMGGKWIVMDDKTELLDD